jgi:uncharacterized protein
MPLTFNIHHVEPDDLELKGTLPASELQLDLNDEALHEAGPLEYDLEAQRLEGGILVHGELNMEMEYECVRCLTHFRETLNLPDWACHLALTGDDAVPVNNDLVDLTPYLREDILLALPQHPLCRPDCGGLELPASVMDPGKESGQTSSAWDELNKLKL